MAGAVLHSCPNRKKGLNEENFQERSQLLLDSVIRMGEGCLGPQIYKPPFHVLGAAECMILYNVLGDTSVVPQLLCLDLGLQAGRGDC